MVLLVVMMLGHLVRGMAHSDNCRCALRPHAQAITLQAMRRCQVPVQMMVLRPVRHIETA